MEIEIETETKKIFKTKTGYCHILPDSIILTRDGVIGNVAKATVGNNIARPLIIYSIIAIGLFFFAFKAFQSDRIFPAGLYTIMGIYLLYTVLKGLNNSATPMIDRSKIQAIKFINAQKGLTRSRFEVLFEDDNGKIKKRLIMLPGSMTDGANETEKALKIMKEEQLIK